MSFSGKFIFKESDTAVFNALYEGDFYGWHWTIVKADIKMSSYANIILYVDVSKLGNIIEGMFRQLDIGHGIDMISDYAIPSFGHKFTRFPLWDNGFTRTYYLFKALEDKWTDERRLIAAAKGETDWESMTSDEISNYVYSQLMLSFPKYVRMLGSLDEYSRSKTEKHE